MRIEELFVSPTKVEVEEWQLGSVISNELQDSSIVLLFCSDERGRGGGAEHKNFGKLRNEFYKLSKLDFKIPICDLGDLISGKTIEDTHCILQEILVTCLQKDIVPIVVGGSNDLSYSLFKALNYIQKGVGYTQINSSIHLGNEGNGISEKNFLAKIFGDKNLRLNHYYHLAYQKHLNEIDAVNLMKAIDFEVVRLADMAGTMDNAEPFLRRADLVTLDCDAVESFAGNFSTNPQVNGLNRREICACMKEVGLGEMLKLVGIFNFNFANENILNYQLLAQMLWYLIEGIHIQKTHPKQRQYETYIVMIEDLEYFFKRDVFNGNWYFGSDEDIMNCTPCSKKEYEDAKRGNLAKRFR